MFHVIKHISPANVKNFLPAQTPDRHQEGQVFVQAAEVVDAAPSCCFPSALLPTS